MKFLKNSFQKTDLFYTSVIADHPLLESLYANHSKFMQSCLNGYAFKNMRGEEQLQFNVNLLPFFLCQNDIQPCITISETVHTIIEKITEAFISGDDKVQDFFSKYKIFIPFFKKVSNQWQSLTRYDVIVDHRGILKFTEFNTSSPGGMLKATAANHTIRDHFLKINPEKFILQPFEQPHSFENYLFSLEKHNAIQPETIAFLYDNHRLQLELHEMKERVERAGRKAVVTHVNKLIYKNNCLYSQDEKISTIYNNFFLAGENLSHNQGPWESNQETFLTEHPYAPFFQGILDNASLLIIGFAALTLIEDKSIFCLMHDPKFQYLFTITEQEFIQQHIPYSRNYDETFINNATDMKKTIANKDNLVLKVKHSALGLGVFMGSEFTETDWEKLLKKNVGIAFLQERIYGKKMPALFGEDRSHTDKMNIVFSIYNYSGEYYGMVARISEGDVTNMYSRGMYQPMLSIES